MLNLELNSPKPSFILMPVRNNLKALGEFMPPTKDSVLCCNVKLPQKIADCITVLPYSDCQYHSAIYHTANSWRRRESLDADLRQERRAISNSQWLWLCPMIAYPSKNFTKICPKILK